MKYLLIFIICSASLSCDQRIKPEIEYQLEKGFWRVTLEVQDGEQLPFIIEAKDTNQLIIQNGQERIEVDEIVIKGDSIRIQTPVFEGYFSGRFSDSGKVINGSFIKPSLDRVVPFTMVYGTSSRFPKKKRDFLESEQMATLNVAGSWETVFSPDVSDERYIAKGIFKQRGKEVTGTFRTTTGDYRYLEGTIENDTLRLSTFDGAHAFLFKAKITDSTMKGIFYSGNHFKENFRAKRNDNYELPDATELTHLKAGYDRFDFSFPNENGKVVSLSDEQFQDKVVLVQIMGSWCPNCVEESKFYRDYILENKNDDLEIVALAFEYALTKEKAFASIKRLKDRLSLPYPILLAQYGDSDKKKAQEKLPMLDHVLSYPTTIFIDKKGEVRRIHTGYNGTATGEKHIAYKKEFEEFVSKLLAEDVSRE